MPNSQRGFSLLEIMVVVLVLSVIMGAIFTTVNQVQYRSAHEQVKLDQFQESREFVDQITRDLHQAGYPNARLYSPGILAGINDTRNAVGLVKVDNGDLWFEGDVDADGDVDSVRYHLDTTGANCPCLRRSAELKLVGNPLTGQTANYQTEVQNVQNGTDPVFTAWRADGTQVTLPVDISANPNTIADIRTVRISLRVRAPNPDLQTGLRPETNISTAVRMANCSGAASGSQMSCL